MSACACVLRDRRRTTEQLPSRPPLPPPDHLTRRSAAACSCCSARVTVPSTTTVIIDDDDNNNNRNHNNNIVPTYFDFVARWRRRTNSACTRSESGRRPIRPPLVANSCSPSSAVQVRRASSAFVQRKKSSTRKPTTWVLKTWTTVGPRPTTQVNPKLV